MNILSLFLILLAHSSQSFRIISMKIVPQQSTSYGLTSGKPFPSQTQMYNVSPKEETKSVIVLKDGKAVPYTKEKSPLSTPDMDKFPSEEEEEGVGPSVSVDYSPALPLNSALTENETNDDLKVEYSDIHPTYVKPPNDFKPIIFPNRKFDGVAPDAKTVKNEVTIPAPPKPYPYKYPHGLSSWLLGGIRGLERGGFWESLASDESLHDSQPDRIPLDIASWLMKPLTSIPLRDTPTSFIPYRPPLLPPLRKFHAQRRHHQSPVLNSWVTYESKNNRPSHSWEIPSVIIENVEIVPLSSKASQASPTSFASSKVSHNYADLITSDGKIYERNEDANARKDFSRVIAATVLFDSEPEHYNVVNVD